MGNSVTHSFIRSSFPSKRKKISEDRESGGYDIDDSLFTPKRRKLMSTSKYIYKTLFEEGQGNDVKIIALNREWNLHRIYLSQSPYFNSMFNGLWVETSQKEIRIGIEDENITSEALHKVFGSLYQDEINIEPSEAVSVLAAATLLQLEDLIQQSVEVMKES
ncbi:Germ cell-less protein-like 1, partial [Stegodyphus mimosarum]